MSGAAERSLRCLSPCLAAALPNHQRFGEEEEARQSGKARVYSGGMRGRWMRAAISRTLPMPGKAEGLQGGYHGLAELLHGRAAQPGVAVTCGVQLDDLLPPWGPRA